MAERRLDEAIDSGLASLGFEPRPEICARLAEFVEILAKWNRTYNLTAVRETGEMVSRHVLDSLAAAPFLTGPRVADVGTGAGLPGIPLALLETGLSFTLIDSSGKRMRFVRHVVGRLGLGNVDIFHGRVQDYSGRAGFDTVISRAYSTIGDFVRDAGHLCGPRGRMLAMKGKIREKEMGSLPVGWQLSGCHRLDVPGIDAERHLVVLIRSERNGTG